VEVKEGARFDWKNVAGPVAHAYEFSRAPMAVIVGPTGGGKTQVSARRCLSVALWQHPSPRDGIRKARIACLAPTYPLLWDTAIKSFKKVFPDSLGGKWVGSEGRPATYTVDLKLQQGNVVTKVHLEVEFRSISDKDPEEFVRGREVTAFWFPEMDQADMSLVELAANRIGRYPEPEDRPENAEPAYAGIFGDSNAPIIGSAFYQRFYIEKAKRRGHDEVHLQPPGLLEDGSQNPSAENLHNLRKIRPDYYQWLAAGMDEHGKSRLLCNKVGYSRHGKPVQEHFDRPRHVALGPIEPDTSLLLEIGVDAGATLKPAAVFTQRSWSGQRRFLGEISPVDRQMDITEFAIEVRRLKDTRFIAVRHAVIYVDPSARAKSVQNRAMSYAQILQGECGMEVVLAPSNDPGIRRSAVDQAHKRSAGPGEPGVLVDPIHCPRLIEAWEGGYRFRKLVGQDVYSLTPEKNDHSHEAEAAQYVILTGDGLGTAVGGFIPPLEVAADAGAPILGD
jgi:hypothetical protein